MFFSTGLKSLTLNRTKPMNNNKGWLSLFSLKCLVLIWIPIVIITLLHYSTGHYLHWLHDILRRLYYIPIIIGALLFGRKGGLIVAVTVSILYFPHAFMSVINRDPAGSVDKALEIVLYNLIALITGFLAEKLQKEKEKYRKTAEYLEEKLEEVELLEEQLIRSGKLQALGEMTAGLAHEIKNPLASIKGTTEIINDEIPENSPKQKLITIQKKEFSRLLSLLDRFLSFAKPQKVDMSDINLENIISYAINLIETQIKRGNIEILFKKPSEHFVIRGNNEKLAQVLINFLLNAVEAIEDSGRIELRLSKQKRGRHNFVSLAISDNGKGIPEEIREKIFNPFFTTKNSGTGLGLSIAARIVEQHKGFIEILETPDKKGTTFSLNFPFSSMKPNRLEL